MSSLNKIDSPIRNQAESEFLLKLGERVKRMRTDAGLSRRKLADTSGLSERFIAQLEHGEANISVLRLCNLGKALDAPVEAFLPPMFSKTPARTADEGPSRVA
ncbi:helix-turn-helix domain-containing protein [Acuticoccus sp. MNP-M23]|uniref:helix-turn-helix domain-containing protein n=1 Tax=Acuticoccus sp. MNP-M23 TaxID=3072793 RepID=UPI0028154E9B|nr:helix-turn-helix domain-containing protein [Acuticoccus sp. MNP-M23]WMS42457.1 helix-turn-helix domain-containing protein [Acuticoccus sp. MNP-M23]